jgi:hypothetical protein
VPFALASHRANRQNALHDSGDCSSVPAIAAASLTACSANEAGEAAPSVGQTIPAADLAHIQTCVDAAVQGSGQASSVTVYPTNAEALKQGTFIGLPITQTVSGDAYLVWVKGEFTDPYGMQPPPDTSVMWMVMPAGSPNAPCPTDDVGIGATGIDPTVLGPGVPVT